MRVGQVDQQEIKAWKTQQLQEKTYSISCWESLRHLESKISGRLKVEQPSAIEFVNLLAHTCLGF